MGRRRSPRLSSLSYHAVAPGPELSSREVEEIASLAATPPPSSKQQAANPPPRARCKMNGQAAQGKGGLQTFCKLLLPHERLSHRQATGDQSPPS